MVALGRERNWARRERSRIDYSHDFAWLLAGLVVLLRSEAAGMLTICSSALVDSVLPQLAIQLAVREAVRWGAVRGGSWKLGGGKYFEVPDYRLARASRQSQPRLGVDLLLTQDVQCSPAYSPGPRALFAEEPARRLQASA